jgi:hypothetical protein
MRTAHQCGGSSLPRGARWRTRDNRRSCSPAYRCGGGCTSPAPFSPGRATPRAVARRQLRLEWLASADEPDGRRVSRSHRRSSWRCGGPVTFHTAYGAEERWVRAVDRRAATNCSVPAPGMRTTGTEWLTKKFPGRALANACIGHRCPRLSTPQAAPGRAAGGRATGGRATGGRATGGRRSAGPQGRRRAKGASGRRSVGGGGKQAADPRQARGQRREARGAGRRQACQRGARGVREGCERREGWRRAAARRQAGGRQAEVDGCWLAGGGARCMDLPQQAHALGDGERSASDVDLVAARAEGGGALHDVRREAVPP